MSTFQLIYEATTKRLSDFKNIHEYTSHYQAAFDKVVSLLIETFSYTQQSTEMYFQAKILINIRTEYLALASVIQKNWKDEIINQAKTVLQIINNFEFMEESDNAKIVL